MLATHMLRLSRLGLLVCAASVLAATGGPSRPDAALSQAKAALERLPLRFEAVATAAPLVAVGAPPVVSHTDRPS